MNKTPQPLAHTGQGSQSITIDWNDFIKGVSTSDKFGDQGFSPHSYNINLLSSIGQISSTSTPINSNMNVQFVATCSNVDNNSPTGYVIRAVDSTGRFWSCDINGNWTDSNLQDSSNGYTSQYTDMVSFYGQYYASTNNFTNGEVCNWDGVSSITNTWFHDNFKVATVGQYLKVNTPHPMIVFNRNLYIADGNMLHKWDGASSYQYGQLTFDTDAVIGALAIDPNSGRMMVAYCQARSVAEVPARANVGLYDGTNPTQFVKIVPMDDIVRCLYSVGGNVYVGYGYNLGIWNGAGVTFLRQLGTLVTPSLHKQIITSLGNDIYFYDNGHLYCYTEIQGLGKKVFNRVYNTTGQVVHALYNINANSVIGFSSTDVTNNNYVYSINVGSAGTQGQTALFQSNWYYFPRPVYIRAIDISMTSVLQVGDTVVPSILDDNGISNPTDIATIDSTIPTATSRLNAGGTLATTACQFLLTMNTSIPFRRVIIYYDPAE